MPVQAVDMTSNWGPSNYNPAVNPSRRWRSTYFEHYLDPTERNSREAYWKKRATANRAKAAQVAKQGVAATSPTHASTNQLHPCQRAFTVSALGALSAPGTYIVPADATKRPYIINGSTPVPLFPTLALSGASSPKLVRANSASTLLAKTLTVNLDDKWKDILSSATNLHHLEVKA